MTREEMLQEIHNIKLKLASECSPLHATNMLIALMALYESVIKTDAPLNEKEAA